MRILGVDIGRRRIGLAVSDVSAALARPWQSVSVAGDAAGAAEVVGDLVRAVADDPDRQFGAIVVGLPRRLNGEDTDLTAGAREFARLLGARTGLEVFLQDERLTSREAEARLALHERDWRKRKARIDAAAAAIILQDFLDARARSAAAAEPADAC